jgi:hypothetical protein
MSYIKTGAAMVLVCGIASCASGRSSEDYRMSVTSEAYVTSRAPRLDRDRKVAEQDCSKPVDLFRGNLRCK